MKYLRIPHRPALIEIEVEQNKWTDAQIGKLTCAVIGQAMLDGMDSLEMRVSPDGRSVRLRYSKAQPTGQSEFYDMSPPPVELYTSILKYLIANAHLATSLPLNGIIAIKRGSSKSRIDLRIEEVSCVTLAWTPLVI